MASYDDNAVVSDKELRVGKQPAFHEAAAGCAARCVGCAVGSFILQRCGRNKPVRFLKRSFGHKNEARKSFRSIIGDLRFPLFCYI